MDAAGRWPAQHSGHQSLPRAKWASPSQVCEPHRSQGMRAVLNTWHLGYFKLVAGSIPRLRAVERCQAVQHGRFPLRQSRLE